MDSAILAVLKKSWRGAPTELNYAAMIYSLVARLIERIPTIKDLIKRVENDITFRLECGFLISDVVPSKASHSRLISKLSESEVIENINNLTLLQAIEEGFVQDENVAVDACHFEARDQAPAQEKRKNLNPKDVVVKRRKKSSQLPIKSWKQSKKCFLIFWKKYSKMEEQLGYEKHQRRSDEPSNYRNGSTKRKLKTQFGEVEVNVSRERKGVRRGHKF